MEMTEHSHTLEYEYVNSDYLGMTIAISPEPHKGYFENWKYMKIAVYIKMDSPYGWTKRELKHTPFGFERKDFKYTNDIRLYIEEAVSQVYSKFPQKDIDEFYNEVIEKISWI